MAGPIISEGWADALEPGIREWFFLGAGQRKNIMREKFFNVIKGTKAVEHFENFGAIAPDAWRNFQQSGRVASVGFDRGYKTNITPGEFIVELPVRRSFLEDNLYSQILQPSQQLGDSAQLLMETDAASVLNNAFSGSYLGGDGVALCSASHPNGPEVSGTQSNTGTSALTVDSIEATRLAMQAYKDDKGNLIGGSPDMIIVPPGLDFSALQLNNSPMDPRTANNAVNPRFGAYEIVRWDYLTDSNNWFMVDSVKMKMNLLWVDRVPLDIRLKNQDTTVFATWIARTRFGYGWTDWRWIYGHNVT
jgi:phage major head subunit gpT-like protein